MLAVVDVAKAEARIEKYLAVRGLGSHAAEIMTAIKACSEQVPREKELQEGLARMVSRKVAEGMQEATDMRVTAAQRELTYQQRELTRLRRAAYRAAGLFRHYREFLALNLPSSDDARAFFDQLDDVMQSIGAGQGRAPNIYEDLKAP